MTIDDHDRVLLFGYRNPATGEEFWATPGGGIEPGESPEEAARREFREETGHELMGDLGPVIWRRQVEFDWGAGKGVRQDELFFYHRVESLVVDPALESARQAEGVIGHGWFTLAELVDPVGFSPSPRRIAELTEALLRDGSPDTPTDVGL